MDQNFVDNFIHDLRTVVTKLLEPPPVKEMKWKVEKIRVLGPAGSTVQPSASNLNSVLPTEIRQPGDTQSSEPVSREEEDDSIEFNSMESCVSDLKHDLYTFDSIHLVTLDDCRTGLNIMKSNLASIRNLRSLHLNPSHVGSHSIQNSGDECEMIGALVTILPSLSCLDTFEWLGFEKPEDELWDCLSRHCPKLRTIRTVIGARDLTSDTKLFRLKDLEHLSIYSTCSTSLRPAPIDLPWAFFLWLRDLGPHLCGLTLSMVDNDCRPMDATNLVHCKLPRLRHLDVPISDQALSQEFNSHSLNLNKTNVSETEWQSWEFFKQERQHKLLAWLEEMDNLDHLHVSGSWNIKDFPSDAPCAPLTSFTGTLWDTRVLSQRGCYFTTLHLTDTIASLMIAQNRQASVLQTLFALVESFTLECSLDETVSQSFIVGNETVGNTYARFLTSFLSLCPRLSEFQFLCNSRGAYRFTLMDLISPLIEGVPHLSTTLEALQISKFPLPDQTILPGESDTVTPKMTLQEEGSLECAKMLAQGWGALKSFTCRLHTEFGLSGHALSMNNLLQEQNFHVERHSSRGSVAILSSRSLVKSTYEEGSPDIRRVKRYEMGRVQSPESLQDLPLERISEMGESEEELRSVNSMTENPVTPWSRPIKKTLWKRIKRLALKILL